jgi:hypothetical protein
MEYQFMRFRILSIVLLILQFAAQANAAQLLPTAHPKTYCELAAGLGYPSRGYNKSTGGCASNMKPIGGAGPNGLENNLAYYVMGEFSNPSRLMRLSLILNINNSTEKASAHAELARVASGLARKVLGSIPKGFEQSILMPASQQWSQGDWQLEVKHSAWSTGLGYDITVYLRPPED